jgi:hypothetical protein
VGTSYGKVNKVLSSWTSKPINKHEILASIAQEHQELQKKLSELFDPLPDQQQQPSLIPGV